MTVNSFTQAEPPLPIEKFDNLLGQRVIAIHRWAVRQGLRGASAEELFDGYCQQLVADGMALSRVYGGMRTLHPQLSGYGWTWRRSSNAIEPEEFARSSAVAAVYLVSPVRHLLERADAGELNPSMRRRIALGPEQRDFPILEDLYKSGATDYYAQTFIFADGDPAQGSGVFYSFAVDAPGGFREDDIVLLQSTLPGLSLAMKAQAGYKIASGLLRAYLGEDAARRVHAGAVERGSVESLHVVLWYADIRGFTPIADAEPGLTVVRLLDEVFETLTAPLRARGGQVLKFIGDGMLAIFSFADGDKAATCRRALEAATEAMKAMELLNAGREYTMLPAARVDFALHLGDVLYGNIGAADRLDFTVIGHAVNEVDRIEKLCEPLGRSILFSAEFAKAAGESERLVSLGLHELRGVREKREIFGLASDVAT
jgi:adenylate cyclase